MNIALLTSENPLRVKVLQMKGETATLALPDKQVFEVNKKYLPKNVKESDILYLDLISKSQLGLNKKEIAKAVLAEILG